MAKAQLRNPFVGKTETIHHEEWPDEMTVTVREYTHGDREYIEGMITKEGYYSAGADGTPIVDIGKIPASEMRKMVMEKIIRGIAEWTLQFPDSDSPAPITAETLDQLPERYITFINEAIEEINPTAPDEDFLGNSGNDDGTG